MSPFCRELSLLLLLLAHAQADNCLTAIVGETVQIPCSLNTQESLKTEDISLEWRTTEDLIVHSFVKGQDYLTNQDPQFKGRTQLFMSELSRGNLSLRLSSVSVTDEGEYACYYHRAGESSSRQLCQVCLQIAADNCLTAIVEETVQIPCSLNTRESLKTEDISVEWTTSEDLIVHSFLKGQDNLTNQAPQFKGRTQLFRSELSRGNLSLRLSNVSLTDKGVYVCYYFYQTGESIFFRQLCRVCLQIADLIIPEKESNGKNVVIMGIHVLVAVPVLVGLLIVVIVMLKRMKRKRHREPVTSKDQESKAPLQQTPNKDNPEA